MARCRGSGARSGRLARSPCQCALRAVRCSATHRRKKQQPSGKNTLDLSPEQMLRTKQYWLCAGAVCFFHPGGAVVQPHHLKTGHGARTGRDCCAVEHRTGQRGQRCGTDADAHAQRPHRPPRHRPWLFAASLGLSAAFWAARGWWVVVCYAGLTFCYSALAAVLPALSTDLFGLPHAGVNYGFLALGQSVGSLAFPFCSQPAGAGERAAPACHGRCGGGFCSHLGAASGAERPALKRAKKKMVQKVCRCLRQN